jgi:hypothetical protein
MLFVPHIPESVPLHQEHPLPGRVGDEAAKNAVEFKVSGCFFAFRDVPPEESRLPLGVEMESAIEAVREDFALLHK